jgi:uncharacterized protein
MRLLDAARTGASAPMKSALALSAILILMIVPAARAADDAGPQVRVIEVNGDGEAHAAPDVANLSFQIETHATTAEQAATRNAARADKVMAVLKSKVGEKGKVQTGGYSLNPDYSQRPGHEPVVIGYNAQNAITVETPDLKGVGALIDSAVAAGANRINYLNFSLKDGAKARAEAIAIASRNAQTQAQALAQALGVRLGRIVKATTLAQVRPFPVPVERMGMAMAATAPTPVEPGEVTVPATVTLTYEIE